MPMLAIGAASLGSSIIGGIASNKAANKSAQGYQQAMTAANDTQNKFYNQTRTDQSPFLQAGQTSVGNLSQLVNPGGDLYKNFDANSFQTDPGYQFRLDQGNQALERSAAARGGVLGGGQLKALDQYNQNFASNEYQNAYNRFQTNRNTQYNQLLGTSQIGQNSANTLASVGQNTANQIGNNDFQGYTGAANAQASGYLGVGNAINSGIGSTLSGYLNNKAGNYNPLPSGGSV